MIKLRPKRVHIFSHIQEVAVSIIIWEKLTKVLTTNKKNRKNRSACLAMFLKKQLWEISPLLVKILHRMWSPWICKLSEKLYYKTLVNDHFCKLKHKWTQKLTWTKFSWIKDPERFLILHYSHSQYVFKLASWNR